MANQMQHYFLNQPQTLRRVLNTGLTNASEWALSNKDARYLRLIGSGSSYHMAHAAKPLFERLAGVETIVSLPTDLSKVEDIPSQEAIVLISQEGRSVNTCGIARRLRRMKRPFALLTAIEKSPTAELTDTLLLMECGPETSGPKTIGVLSTYVSLAMMAVEWGRARGTATEAECAETIQALWEATENLQENIERCKAWHASATEAFQRSPAITLISSHAAKPFADEAALKLVETIYTPACAYEAEEFVHGPHCLLGSDMLLIGLMDGGSDDRRIRDICAFGKEKGSAVLLISTETGTGEDGLSLIGNENCPFHLLLPIQYISAWLAEEEGHDLDHPKFAGFATRFGSKLF